MNNKINIIFWSGTGNTESMAQAIYEGSKKGGNSKLLTVDKATLDDVVEADILFLGCPSMGVEELEESEMEPFMESISNDIDGKKIILFGSYGWGDGEWMQDWEQRIKNYGGTIVEESIICNESPEEDVLKELTLLGQKYSN
ncbi:flavodoxin [Terrisporobacter petrolearius]|uniref:flavodoxin n=1 Tax=Terrisporobacter petrolearius TaxID=1460447 RepID=UPI001D16CC09|nr:flavodoxin [Terrisporobacter petrolearius]MCC3864149.1 flavodoxin [Terrisporobacter petrolearius]